MMLRMLKGEVRRPNEARMCRCSLIERIGDKHGSDETRGQERSLFRVSLTNTARFARRRGC